MQESIVFLLRVQCRRKESSRSLSHLLMSFLLLQCCGKAHDHDRGPNLGASISHCCTRHHVTSSITQQSIHTAVNGHPGTDGLLFCSVVNDQEMSILV